ncbi:MAG: hypothetical protein ACR2MX_01660 [Cyclobacteriaceae bacterium]
MTDNKIFENAQEIIDDCRRMTKCIYLVCDTAVAADVCLKTKKAINLIEKLLEERKKYDKNIS